jgi:hypothetical protein
VAASSVHNDYDLSMDIHDVTADVQANYPHMRRGRK